MTDSLFSNIETHKATLKKNQDKLVYCNDDFHQKIGLRDLTCSQQPTIKASLPTYKYFKTVTLEDMLYLQANVDVTNTDHQFWMKKIYRFLEFRLSSIEERIQKNYANKTQRITFIQHVITLLLIYADASKDYRYLSLALKLLRKKSLATQGLFNLQYNAQYTYNVVVAHSLIKNL